MTSQSTASQMRKGSALARPAVNGMLWTLRVCKKIAPPVEFAPSHSIYQ